MPNPEGPDGDQDTIPGVLEDRVFDTTFLKLASVGEKAKTGGCSKIFSWVLKLLKAIQKKGR